MRKNYFSMTQSGDTATINIYGDISSWDWCEKDMSANKLSKQLDELTDVSVINVCINSYGGEVAEGLAIYNALKRHKAKIKTYCDGFACSIASVIFMAGDERIMSESSLLMIHNAWTWTQGNAEELRKQADDLEKITQASVNAYKAHSTLSEEEIKALMDNETWILPEEATEWGFATSVDKTENTNASQNAKMSLRGIILKYREELDDDEEKDPEGVNDDEDDDEGKNPEGVNDDEDDDEGKNPDNPDSDTPKDPPDDNSDDDEEEEEETDDEKKEATQKWVGFFNALLN